MLMKLLLMVLVIAGAVFAVRMRQPPANAAYAHAPLPVRPRGGRRALVRLAAATVVVLMILGSGLFLFQQWRDAQRIVTVRVIDTGSGRSVTYEVYQGDLEGRSFRTTDGRVVTLAEVERMETQGNRSR